MQDFIAWEQDVRRVPMHHGSVARGVSTLDAGGTPKFNTTFGHSGSDLCGASGPTAKAAMPHLHAGMAKNRSRAARNERVRPRGDQRAPANREDGLCRSSD